MTRQRASVVAAVFGVLLVAVSKTYLVWTYGSPTERANGAFDPHSGYTLRDIGDQLQYSNHPWQLAYDGWLLWTVLLATGVFALLGLTRHARHRELARAALIAGLLGAAASAVEAKGLVGPTFRLYQRVPGPTFRGAGPGPYVAVVGFLLLGAAAVIGPRPTPVEPGSRARVIGSGVLASSGVAAVLWAINGLAWWDVGQRDQPSPFGYHELLVYLHYAGTDDSLASGFFRGVLSPLIAVAAVCVLTSLLRPGLGRALRPVGAVAAVVAPAMTLAVLAFQWREGGSPSYPTSQNPLDSMLGGFWVLAAGCLLLASAALVAPGQKTPGQKTPGQKTMGQWATRPTGPNASDAA